MVSQVMAGLSAEVEVCCTCSTFHPQGFSFGVPLTVNQTIFMTLKKFKSHWILKLLVRVIIVFFVKHGLSIQNHPVLFFSYSVIL